MLLSNVFITSWEKRVYLRLSHLILSQPKISFKSLFFCLKVCTFQLFKRLVKTCIPEVSIKKSEMEQLGHLSILSLTKSGSLLIGKNNKVVFTLSI